MSLGLLTRSGLAVTEPDPSGARGQLAPRGLRAQQARRRPYLSQTLAMTRDPGAALPHHPMILHRGGWPDGS